MKRIRIVLADDHPIVLDGLEQLFGTEPDLEVVARATSAEAAMRALEEFKPDVLVLDLAMPGQTGLWVMEQAAARALPARIVLLTAHVDEQQLLEAVRLGVAGVVLKEMAPRLLTPRELEIVRLAAQGLRNREIAERLSITEGTVKIHLHNIYEKLGVTGRSQLILHATREGLV